MCITRKIPKNLFDMDNLVGILKREPIAKDLPFLSLFHAQTLYAWKL